MAKSKHTEKDEDSIEMRIGALVMLRTKTEAFHRAVDEILTAVVAGTPQDADAMVEAFTLTQDLFDEVNIRWGKALHKS